MALVNEEQLFFEVFLVGDCGVGKSSLLERFGKDTFRESYTPTIGVDFSTWNVPVDGKKIRLQINDVAGRQEYRTAIPDYYKSAHGFIIVYDITDETALSGVNDWLSELDRLANRNVTKILVGNKRDLEAERVIRSEEAKELANKWGIQFVEASAKDGTNVPEIFLRIAADVKNCVQPQRNGSRKRAGFVEIKRRLESQPQGNGSRKSAEFVEIKHRLERLSQNRLRNGDNPLPFPPKKSQREQCDYTFNIIILGDHGVGKSSLMMRFTEDNFTGLYKATIGLDFKTKVLELEGHTAKLLITDTAGQEKFRSLTTSFYRGADGIIIVYDVTSPESFVNLKDWMKEIEIFARQDANKILVGTKCDLTEKAVSLRTAQMLAKQLDIPFLEASAKNATNVDEVFKTIASLIKRRVGPPRDRNRYASREDLISLDATKKERRWC